MKRALSVLSLLVLGFVLSSCSNKDENTNNSNGNTNENINTENNTVLESDLNGIEIDFWHAQSSINGDALIDVVNNFNETNKYGIKVNQVYQGGYTETSTKLNASLVSGDYPNIGQAYGNDISKFTESGKVKELTNYFNDEVYGYTDEEIADFVPSYLEEMFSFPGNKAYQTMMAKSSEMMYYNVDFFEEHDLKVPTTTDELTEVAKEASKIMGKEAFGYDSLTNLFVIYSQAFGAKFTDNEGNIFFGDENNKQYTLDFLNWWKDGVDGGYFRDAGEDQYMASVFNNGDCAFFIGSTSTSSFIEPEDGSEWKPAHIPAGPKGAYTVQQGGNVFMFDSGNDAENLASWIFLSYLMEPKISNKYALATGYVPIRKSSYELDEYKKYLAENGPVGEVKNLVLTYPEGSSKPDPIFPESYSVRKAASTIIEKIIYDKDADPEKILDEVYNNLIK